MAELDHEHPYVSVLNFHLACDLPAPEKPIELTEIWKALAFDNVRWALIEEEFEELKVAIQEQSILSFIDAVCDLEYVLHGALIAVGIDTRPFFEEVHRANMLKTTGPKREDGKQLKPEGWMPPNHATVWSELYG